MISKGNAHTTTPQGRNVPGITPPTHQHHQPTMVAAAPQEHTCMGTHTTSPTRQTTRATPSQHTTDTPTPPTHNGAAPHSGANIHGHTHQITNTQNHKGASPHATHNKHQHTNTMHPTNHQTTNTPTKPWGQQPPCNTHIHGHHHTNTHTSTTRGNAPVNTPRTHHQHHQTTRGNRHPIRNTHTWTPTHPITNTIKPVMSGTSGNKPPTHRHTKPQGGKPPGNPHVCLLFVVIMPTCCHTF